MDSAKLRQSFQDFFENKQHRIVPSSPLLPSAPNLLFTNAGMNPFVPCFLEERAAPHPRVADTQKCIRAGGKHNDLEDVGWDTYHHTFFEMLGNWSFGDYFKKEAIEWAWELLTKVWGLPKERLYVTVYKPTEGEPASFDQEAYDFWKAVLEADGLDPDIHIVYGAAKDNFWMMGDTGPCGPCSEIHIDLTEKGDTKGSLVNGDSAYCMEIWNLVFIQFNATPDGGFQPLANKHVDTGMGLERVAGIFASTDVLTTYGKIPSNYDSDLFGDIFREAEKHCGKVYKATVPRVGEQPDEQQSTDIQLRAMADHLRAVCFAIGDGILPGNEGRNYVIRHILRRGVLAAQRLGMKCGAFTALVDPLIEKMGSVFPELNDRKDLIRKVILSEEESFYRTLDKGLQMFDKYAADSAKMLDGESAFTLYDTYGFPLEMTQMIARERGLEVDTEGFRDHMEAQRERARASQKKSVVMVRSDEGDETVFEGYNPENWLDYSAVLKNVVKTESGESLLVFDRTPFYGEKGGQVGDSGTVEINGAGFEIYQTTIDEQGVYLHHSKAEINAEIGSQVSLSIDVDRRRAIQRHHSATHILHWALRKVVGDHVHQAGSLVTPDRLRFDFSHFEKVSPEQIAEIERMAMEKILANDSVVTLETPFDQKPDDVLAFFEDKYGDTVRVVDIGGYSKELCAGTHTTTAGEIGMLKIVQESAIAAGSRRIEAIAGESFFQWMNELNHAATGTARLFKCKLDEVVDRAGSLLEDKKALQKQLADLKMGAASKQADSLAGDSQVINGVRWTGGVLKVGNPNELRGLGVRIQKEVKEGVVLIGAELDDKVSIVCLCSDDAIKAGLKAGDILREVAGKLGGKGGGKPDFAMGGAKNDGKLAEVIQSYLRG
ncbi:MAG: alanine--tRNA ligase [Opitutales bacterium]|nr:alanine--tRNA ligase [Opitutales bacterium]